MSRSDLKPILLRAAALALLVGGVGWALVGLAGGWVGADAFALTETQMRASLQPFLVLLLLGLPGFYFGLRTGQSWVLMAGTIVMAVGVLALMLGTATAFGITGRGGDQGGETTIAVGTVILGIGALVAGLGLIRQGGTADWISVLLAALGLLVIPALLVPRLAFAPGLCWAALGVTVWLAAAEADADLGRPG